MSVLRLAGPLLEYVMTHTQPTPRLANVAEPMIDSRTASSALRLPYYWFHDKTMRVRRRIPHYMIGTLVRYRMSELLVWMDKNRKHNTTQGDTHA